MRNKKMYTTIMVKVAFFDRDGVINKMIFQNGKYDSPQKVSHVELIEGVTKVIAWLNEKNIPVIEVTNQPGVALGKIDWQTLERIEKKIHDLLYKHGAKVNKIYRCFHHPESIIDELKIECDCRKPKAGMLIKASEEMDIELNGRVFLGDNDTDMEAGRKAGVKTILFYHSNDTPEKVAARQNYPSDFRVYSHQETLLILKKLFK